MSAAVVLSERRCAICGEPLVDRRPHAKTCRGACRTALHRLRKAGLTEKLTKLCECCAEEFVPRRSDAKYCDGCRRTQRWRRDRSKSQETTTAPGACCVRPCPEETPGGGPWHCANCGVTLPTPDWVPQ